LLVGTALLLISTAVRVLTSGVRQFGERAIRFNAELADLMIETIAGMRIVRAFGRERYEQARFDRCSNRVRVAFLRMHLLEEAVHPIHDSLAAALLLMIVFVTIRSGGDASSLLAFVFVLYRLQPRVKDFDASRARLAALSPSVDAVRALVDTAGKRYLTSGPHVQPALARGIVFDQVSFRYDTAEEPALTGVSFTIAAGRTTA